MHGEMAINAPIAYASKPQCIPLSSLLDANEEITMVRSGGHRCALITSKQRVLTWGENDYYSPSFRKFSSSPSSSFGSIIDLALTSNYTIILHNTSLFTTPSMTMSSLTPTKADSKKATDNNRSLSYDWYSL